VAISDGEGGSCTATLGGGGSGSCQLSSSSPGDKTLTATYNGSGSYDGGSSDTAPHHVNTPPTANNDGFVGTVLLPFGSGAPGVLGNDTDPDGPQGLTAVLESGPANGALQLNPNGSFVYTPTVSGTFTFTYRANDGRADSAPATVTLQVLP
jgi:hypothetical protein